MESLFSLNPGPYHTIDAHATSLLDFHEDLKQGLNVTFRNVALTKSTGFDLELSPSPLFMSATARAYLKNANFSLQVNNNEDVVAEFRNHMGRDIVATMVASAKLQSLKQLFVNGTLQYRGNRFVTELRASNKNDGLVGVSHLHALNRSFAVGFDSFFQPTSKLASGSAALRYQGQIGRAPFQTKVSIDEKQVVSLSAFTVMHGLSLAARVCLDHLNQQHTAAFGTSLWFSLYLGGHLVPITVTGRTSTQMEHAVLVHVPLPTVVVLLNTTIKQNKPTFGVSLCF